MRKLQKWFLLLAFAVGLVACMPLAETVAPATQETQTAEAGPVFAPVPEAPEGVVSSVPATEGGQEKNGNGVPEGTQEQTGGIQFVGTYEGDHLIESGQAKVLYTDPGTSLAAFVVMMTESDFGDRYVIPLLDGGNGGRLVEVYRSSVVKTFVFTYEGIQQRDAFDMLYRCAFISTAENLLTCVENLPRGQPTSTTE